MESSPYTKTEYLRALRALGPSLSELRRRMLLAHAGAARRTMTVLSLARAVGRNDEHVTYSEYGKLGRQLSEAIAPRADLGIWTWAIGAGFLDSRTGLVAWTMWPQLAEAIANIGWVAASSTADPVSDIRRAAQSFQTVGPTTRKALVDARVGQGGFRDALVMRWGACAVTGCGTLEALRASHIKPWRVSRNRERLDPDNGLLLIGTLDALFDSGVITFSDRGKLLVSSRLTGGERRALGITDRLRLRQLNVNMRKYLAYHRQHVFGAQ